MLLKYFLRTNQAYLSTGTSVLGGQLYQIPQVGQNPEGQGVHRDQYNYSSMLETILDAYFYYIRLDGGSKCLSKVFKSEWSILNMPVIL